MEERIKAIRKAAKLTQTKFGERIGVNGSTVTTYEKGIRTPSEAVVRAICREFGVDRHWLETGEGSMQTESQAQMLDRIARRYSDSSTFRALLNVYVQLSPEEQDAVEHYIALLAKALDDGRDPATVDPLSETIDIDADYQTAAQLARAALPPEDASDDAKAHA